MESASNMQFERRYNLKTAFNMQFKMNIQFYPYLPKWYQIKMKLERTSFSSAWEESNPAWNYFAMA